MPTLLLSAPLGTRTDDLRPVLASAGFTVADHLLGAAPAVDFNPVAVAVIDPGERTDLAAAQTRRWRGELGDMIVPIVWLLPAAALETTLLALDAGADLVLARPVDAGVLAKQLKALARTQATAHRLSVKAAESRLLGTQLQIAYARLERELEMARRVHRSFLPRSIPEVGPIRFAICYRPRSRVGGDFYNILRLDESHVGFFLGDVMTHGSAIGSLLSVFIKQSVRLKEIAGRHYRLLPPDEVLIGVNRELLGLGLDEPPLVAMLVGSVDVAGGNVSVARAGGPAPIHIPAAGEPRIWSVPGPFLGTADTSYQIVQGQLVPGDKLLLGSDGTRPEGEPAANEPDPMAAAATRHRSLSGQAFVDAVARDLLPRVRHPDDFTLLCVERV